MNARYDDMYQAASRYYVQGETMDAIAKQLGLSRSSVSRLLKEARETGLVRISLADEAGSRSPLAASIGRTFGVRVHLVAVREGVSEQRRFDQVARLAGRLLSEAVTDHCAIGVAWGVTSSLVVRYLQPKPLVDSIVVQMNGGTNQWSSGIPYVGEILQSVGDAFNSSRSCRPCSIAALLSRNRIERSRPTQPTCSPLGVSRKSALSARNSRRYSAREVNMR